MKIVSQDFIDNEEATQREPVELYHIWRDGGEHWYHTSGDVKVIFEAKTYTPATLKRSSVEYNSTLDVSQMSIDIPALLDPVVDFIVQNPIEILWIQVTKLHRDDLTEGDIVFIGQIKEVTFKGIKSKALCVGFEHFLKVVVPRLRYQLNCNHIIFDSKCNLTKVTYLTSTIITLTDEVELSASAFGLEDDGYFIGGEVVFGDESRAIVYHEGNTIKVMYKFIELVTGNTISAYPGCDGRVETCRDKYSNIINFLGFPFIPLENPSIRVDW